MTRRAKVTTLRALATRLGAGHAHIIAAIRTGRLDGSVGRDARGRPVIVDADLAVREWNSNRAKPAPGRNGTGQASLVDAQREVALERVRALRLRTDRQEGLLVRASDVELLHARLIIAARDALLAVPHKLKALRPDLSRADVAACDQLIRAALEGLADAQGASVTTNGAVADHHDQPAAAQA